MFRRAGLLRLVLAGCCVSAPAVSGCSTLQITVDHDEDTDFSAYRTYSWSTLPQTPTGDPALDDNALLTKRVRQAVDEELAAKGLGRVESGGQLSIHYHAVVEHKKAVLTTRDYEAYGAVEVVRAEHQEVTEYTQGTLIIDIHDAGREALIWRGVARDIVDDLLHDPDRARAALNRAVGRMFESFPP